MKRLSFAVLVLLLSAAGCSQNTINSAAKDTQHNVAVLNKEVNRAAQQAKPELNALDSGARVTAALGANANIPQTIRVDADKNGGVRLRGTVKTAQQKQLAENIAKQTLPAGKPVNDELTVKP